MPQRDDPRHNLRMPPELQKKLKHSAIDAGRSMNAEIVTRLERSFDPDPAAMIAEALQPIASLSESDRRKVGQLLADIGSILSKPTTI